MTGEITMSFVKKLLGMFKTEKGDYSIGTEEGSQKKETQKIIVRNPEIGVLENKLNEELQKLHREHETEMMMISQKHRAEITQREQKIAQFQRVLSGFKETATEFQKARSEIENLTKQIEALEEKNRHLETQMNIYKGKVDEFHKKINDTQDPATKAKALFELKERGLSYGEISKKTGIPKGTVKGTIARYKKSLRDKEVEKEVESVSM